MIAAAVQHYRWRWPLSGAAALVLAASLAAAQNHGAPESIPTDRAAGSTGPETSLPAPSPAVKGTERLRENTKLVDEVGAFQFVGDRVAFFPGNNKDSFRVLENLQLERISRTLGESRAQRQWIVSGVITEFRGANYLLVTKAVIPLVEGESATSP